jgi:hypothetical protein
VSEQRELEEGEHPRVEDSILQPNDGQHPLTRICAYCLMCFPHSHVWQEAPWSASWR